MKSKISKEALTKLINSDEFKNYLLESNEFEENKEVFLNCPQIKNLTTIANNAINSAHLNGINISREITDLIISVYVSGFKIGMMFEGALQEEELFKLYNKGN